MLFIESRTVPQQKHTDDRYCVSSPYFWHQIWNSTCSTVKCHARSNAMQSINDLSIYSYRIKFIRLLLRSLRRNIIKTVLCWVVRHNVHSQQQTYMSSSYTSNRLGLSHWDPCAMRRGGCLEMYYCDMAEWFSWSLGLISTTNCFGRPRSDLWCVEWDVKLPTNQPVAASEI